MALPRNTPSTAETAALKRAGIQLEAVTLGWNSIGVVLLTILAAQSSSVALLGFGLDSLIEIGASAVVIWELTGEEGGKREFALRLIGWAFVALGAYLLVQSVVALIAAHRPTPLLGGMGWTALTAVAMFALAAGKWRVGSRLGNPVLVTEGRVTLIDGILASCVLAGIVLDFLFGWWWADPLAGLIVAVYAIREATHILRK